MTTQRTQVAIVGAGPAGLILAHLLDSYGIESIVVDDRTRGEIETTIRAGILEHSTVDLLANHVAGSRVLTTGERHNGVNLRFAQENHRIDFAALTGRAVWLYPQHEVLKDLIAARLDAGQDLRFSTRGVRAQSNGTGAWVLCEDADGREFQIDADFVVGADGSRSAVREAITGSHTSGFFKEYPFAWFGVLCEAPPSSHELIYSNSDDGFALISRRSETVQRMYFQCDPEDDTSAYSEEQLWDILQRRVPGTELQRGHIFQRDVLRFRSFVASSMHKERLAIVGDAAHTVPPTGAKGMNLAVADVVILAKALRALLREGDARLIDGFEDAVSRRVWKAQHFSWWMTEMLHVAPTATDFDRRRQLGELRSVVESESGRRFLAEGYTGWPFAVDGI